MNIRFDLFSVWNFVLTVGMLAAAGVFLIRTNQKAYIETLKSTGEGWKAATEQKREEIKELSDRLTKLEGEHAKLRDEHSNVLTLNLGLQRQLSDRDMRIVALEAQVSALQREVGYLRAAKPHVPIPDELSIVAPA